MKLPPKPKPRSSAPTTSTCRVPLERALRDLAFALLPVGVVASVGCDTHDAFHREFELAALVKPEALAEWCGDVSPLECESLCNHVMLEMTLDGTVPPEESVFLVPAHEICGSTYDCVASQCEVLNQDGVDTLEVFCECNYPAGRRPPGLMAAAELRGAALGVWFAHLAHLEAAAVHAFQTLAREALEIGLPTRLVSWARRSAAEEVLHTALASRLACEFGVPPVAPQVAPRELRNAAELCIDNAAEGLVRESFAALISLWQANQSDEPIIAAVMAKIATDECGHGEFSWQLHEELLRRDDVDRAAARRAFDDALATAQAELGEIPLPLVSPLGWPSAADRARLFDRFAELAQARYAAVEASISCAT